MQNQIQKTALAAAKKAGQLLVRQYEKFNRLDVMLKSHHEVLTKADLMSQEIIIREIKKNFPAHSIVAEEQINGKNRAGYVWYIDPLDGTTNFSMHNPMWSVSIALAKDDKLIFGLVYIPVLGDIYLAEAGAGAKLNGKKIGVSAIKQGKVLNTYCHGSNEADIKKALDYCRYQKLNGLDCRQIGSAAIELSYLACGRVESFVAPGTHDWDVAAGVLVVREAGGMVTDFNGQDWYLGCPDIAASNCRVHKQILGAIKAK